MRAHRKIVLAIFSVAIYLCTTQLMAISMLATFSMDTNHSYVTEHHHLMKNDKMHDIGNHLAEYSSHSSNDMDISHDHHDCLKLCSVCFVTIEKAYQLNSNALMGENFDTLASHRYLITLGVLSPPPKIFS